MELELHGLHAIVVILMSPEEVVILPNPFKAHVIAPSYSCTQVLFVPARYITDPIWQSIPTKANCNTDTIKTGDGCKMHWLGKHEKSHATMVAAPC